MKTHLLLLMLLASNLYTQAQQKQFTRPLTFIENKGQITDQYGQPRKDIDYKVAGKGVSIFAGSGQLHYQFCKAETKRKLFDKNRHDPLAKPDTTPTRYTMYRLDMELTGANRHVVAVADDKQAYYENYHTAALHNSDAVAAAYNKITYPNIYPFIDWVLYIKDSKLEYDFIVHPGGNVNDIKIKYNGASEIAHTAGNIKIQTPFGDVREQKLYAYEQGTGIPVAMTFNYHKNKIGFSLPDAYTAKQTTLVIDPNLDWATYYGGDGEDECYGITRNSTESIVTCGTTTSVNNIATVGTHQTAYNGFYDSFIASFSNSGTLLWATYYGGESIDYAYGIACDNAGNIYITGQTHSNTNIATSGSYQPIAGGNYDAFFAKFNTAGALSWATYFGGNDYEIGTGISCDALDNIYISGGTQSNLHIATTGSFQDTLTGVASGYFARFNSAGSLKWGTYFYGGTRVCVCNKNNDLYISGGAGHAMVTTSGCYQDSCKGAEDCSIAKFDSSCHLLWSTYFGGDSIENAYSIACDDSLNVYITGFTNSINGIATTGAHQSTFGGGDYDAFLARFNNTGVLQWSTYYGGNGNDEGDGVVCDGTGIAYLTGNTSSGNNISVSGSYQDANKGGLDAFLARFSNTGDLSWATYYGGTNNDGAYGITCDEAGSIYMAGGTASTDNIATSGSYQSSFADSSDAFILKFDTAPTGINSIQGNNKSIGLYPNPNDGSFTICGDFDNTFNSVNIEVLNISGQIMYRNNVVLQKGPLQKKIDMGISAPGLYILKLSTANKTQLTSFSIK